MAALLSRYANRSGTDSGVTGPVSPEHLRSDSSFRLADWVVDPETYRLIRDGESVKLGPKVMELLVYLSARPGVAVTREELEGSVWAGMVVSYDALTGAVQKLRRALGDDPRDPRFIETLSKRGYRLVAPVTELGERLGPANPGGLHGRAAWLGAGLTLLLLAMGALWHWQDRWSALKAPPIDQGDRSIAVLPFDNLSDDPAREHLADGITDDLITGLAKRPDLLVISRDSSFFYKGRQEDVSDVGVRLGVRYVLHGSLRGKERRLRINTQLLETASGTLVWADTYRTTQDKAFELQEDISRDILQTLSLRFGAADRRELGHPATVDSQA